MGDLERVLVGKYDGEVIGAQMEFWFGGQEKDVAQSTRQVQSWVMCWLGVLVGLVDGRMLRGLETKVVGS